MADRIDALQADVVWNVDFGRSTPEIEAFRQKFLATTREVTDDTLRTSVAQGRLDQALARHGPNSRQAASALLALRREEQALAEQSQRTSAAVTRSAETTRAKLLSEERALGRFSRGALGGGGGLLGGARTLAFGSSAFLLGGGLTQTIRKSVEAARDHQVIMGQLEVAVKRAGLSFRDERAEIEETIRSQERLGFTEEASVRSYITLVRATRDAKEATRLQSVAADIARARNVSLETATNAVAKAYGNQGTALKRLIPGLDSTKKGLDLIADAQRRTAGAADAYSKTFAGAQARFDVALHHTEVAIGTALLPQFTRLLDSGAKWLDQEKNQERLAGDFREAMHLLGEAFHYAHDAIDTVDKVTGSFENTIKILIALKIASIVRGWGGAFSAFGAKAVSSFEVLTGSADASTAKVVADAEKMEVALDAATRPRIVKVTTVVDRINQYGTGGTVVTGGGGGGETPAPKKFPTLPLFLGSLPVQIVGGAALSAGGGQESYNVSARAKKYPTVWLVINNWNRAKPEAQAIVNKALAGGHSFATVKEDKLVEAEAALKKLRAANTAPTSTTGNAFDSTLQAGPNAPRLGLNRAQQIELELSRTEGQTGAARVKALRDRVAFTSKYITIQEALIKTDAKNAKQHAATAEMLYGERKAAQAELDQIAADAARSAKKSADAQGKSYRAGLLETEGRLRESITRARTPAGKRRAEDALVAFYKREIADKQLTRRERESYRNKLRAEQTRERQEEAAAAKEARANAEARARNAVERAKIAETEAEKGTPEYAKAVAAEEKADRQLITILTSELRHTKQGTAEARRLQKDILDARKALAEAGKKTPTATSTAKDEIQQFLESFAALQGMRDNYSDRPGQPLDSGPAGQIAAHAYGTYQETRRSNDLLAQIAAANKFPGTTYAHISAFGAFG